MRLADYVLDFLKRNGVEHIFYLPGGAAMHLNDALAKLDGIEAVTCLHEQACAIAAEAYARISEKMGVVLVTSGPGTTNTITGLAGAWLDSTPVFFLSGQVKTTDLKGDLPVRQLGNQEVHTVGLVSGLTRYAVTIQSATEIKFHLEKALVLANSGRKGPVWIDIPLDIQGAEVDPDELTGYFPLETKTRDSEEDLSALILNKFLSAERPVLLVGNGVRASSAIEAFREFVAETKIPTLTTWLAMDLIPDDNQFFFGRPGSMAPRGANFTLQNADFLLVVGARLDMGLVGYSHENFARGAFKVVVDIDPGELKKFGKSADVCVCQDALLFFNNLLKKIRASVQQPNHKVWRAKCREWKVKYPLLGPVHKDPNKKISTYLFSDRLSFFLGSGDIISPSSSGFASEIFFLMYRHKEGQRIFHNRGTGSMGFGLPASIGACLASGRRRTVCVEGDGGLQMNIQELQTLRNLSLPVKLFVINNGGYASISASQSNHFGRLLGADATSGLILPSLQKISAAYEIPYLKIEETLNLDAGILEVLSSDGPVICEVFVRHSEPRTPRLDSVTREDGSITSRPLEDLYPFLEREELKENMFIPLLSSSKDQ